MSFHVRIFVDALGRRLYQDIPIGLYGNTGEGKSEECRDTRRDCETHDDVDGNACSCNGKNASILGEDGNLDKCKANTIGQNAKVEVLCKSEPRPVQEQMI